MAPATEWVGCDDLDVVVLLMSGSEAPLRGDVGGIKAIKAKLAGTLAINENWILTKALISSIHRL